MFKNALSVQECSYLTKSAFNAVDLCKGNQQAGIAGWCPSGCVWLVAALKLNDQQKPRVLLARLAGKYANEPEVITAEIVYLLSDEHCMITRTEKQCLYPPHVAHQVPPACTTLCLLLTSWHWSVRFLPRRIVL